LQVEECEVDEVCVDQENKVVTTPAFMYDATFAQVGQSMHKDVVQCFGFKQILNHTEDFNVGNPWFALHIIRIETTMQILIRTQTFINNKIII
jgi:hypothetical protein